MPPPDDARSFTSPLNVDVADSLSGIDADEWNALAGDSHPFLRHEFLSAAEQTGCVSALTGWTPRHLLLRERNGRLRAAMPLYEKSHSWGEFVFDWAWANAYHRAALPYYPKLVSAAPFTPATSPKLLLSGPRDGEAAMQLLRAALELAKDGGHSSLHLQFHEDRETHWLEAAGFKLRSDCQFHWFNRGYRHFDEFLASFNARKRKKARRDRRRVAEQGVRFRWLTGHDIDRPMLEDVYALILHTFEIRGGLPYFDLAFFEALCERLPEALLVILAERNRSPVGASVFYRSAETLYGRYWGGDDAIDALHFETCYYQGIDYCIRHGIRRFEPGTQGEHKVSRGFVPVATHSAHWLRHPEFFAAIGHFLDEEKRYVDEYMDAVRQHSPYRSEPDREKDQ